MTTACIEHLPVWIESENYTGFECSRCMTMIPTATGICGACRSPVDDHTLLLVEHPVCPQARK